MAGRRTFLAPGQRYVRADLAPWRADRQLTIVRVDRAPDGAERVAYRCPGGRYAIGAAAAFEAAVAGGRVLPVVGAGEPARA